MRQVVHQYSRTAGIRGQKRAAIRAAIAEAGKGEFISQDAMVNWIASWDSDEELPPPEPDIRIR